MEHIDARRALELLTDVVDSYGEDTVYEKVPHPHGSEMTCLYISNDQPSCLVGHALFRAGVTVDVLLHLDESGIAASALDDQNDFAVGENVTSGAARVFAAAQQWQDNGGTWGEALQKARECYESLNKELRGPGRCE